MLFIKYSVYIILSWCISYAIGDTINDIFKVQFVKNTYEECSFKDDKTKEVLSSGKTETEKKLEILLQNFYALDKKISNLEDSINRQFHDIRTKSSGSCEERLNHKLEAISKELPKLKESMNLNLEALNKRIPELEKNINLKLDALVKKAPDCEEKLRHNFNVTNISENKSCELKSAYQENLCKKWIRPNFGIYQLDSNTFNHVVLNKSITGAIEYFEMHIAMKGGRGLLVLTSQPNPYEAHFYSIFLYIHKNILQAVLKGDRNIELTSKIIPSNVVSSASFMTFYIKISHGVLEFGRQCDSSPIIIHSDINISFMKYFSLQNLIVPIEYLYDCPVKNG